MKSPRILSRSISSLVVLGAIAAVQPALLSTAKAADYTWTPTVAGTFDWDSATSNWTAGFPNAVGDVANLTANLAGAQTINLNQVITLGALNIGDPTSGFFGYTIAPNGGSLIFNNNGAGATLATTNVATGLTNSITANLTLADNLTASIQNTNALSISGNITESGGSRTLTKTGAGTLTLSGANTYSGGTTITGILNAASNSALGTGGVTINSGSGNQLQLANGVNISNALTINGGGVVAQGVLYVPTGNATYSGNINIAAAQNSGGHFATANNASVLTLSGNITTSSAVPVTVRLGTVVLSGTNTYTGGTTLGNGGAMIQFAKTASMPTTGTVSLASGTTLAVNAGGSGEFAIGTGAGTIGGLLAGIGTSGAAGSVTMVAGSSLGIDTTNASGKVTLTDSFTSTSNVGLLKLGTGTLELTNGGTYAGAGGAAGFPLVVRQGSLLLNGGIHTVTGEAVVGGMFSTANGAAGYDAKLQVDSGALNISSWLSVGRGNGVGGVSSDLVLNNAATVTAGNLSAGFNGGNASNLPKGSIILNDSSSLSITGNGVLYLGESAGSNFEMTLKGTSQLIASGTGVKRIGAGGNGVLNINDAAVVNTAGNMDVGYVSGSGTVNMNGGTMTVGSLRLAVSTGGANTMSGTVNLNAGTLTSIGDAVVGLGGASASGAFGKLAINGGTLNVGTDVTKWMIVGQYDTTRGQVDINSGNLNLNSNTSIKFSSGNASTASTNVINQNGGNVTFYSDNGATVGGTGDLNLQQSGSAATSNTYNLNGGTLTVPQVGSTLATGTRIFNFNGGLLKAARSNTTFFNLGSGNARANVRNGGAIIDTDGFDVTVDQTLAHSDVSGDNATDGGLTKNGAGTLTLSAANTYNGATNVNAGTLAITNTTGSATGTGAVNLKNGTILTGAGISSGFITLASGATVVPGNNGVGTLSLGSLTLNAGSFLDYEFTDPVSRDFITIANSDGLTINGGTFRLYQPGTTATFDTNGVYNLIGYTGTIAGTGISALSVDSSTISTGKAYTFGTAGGFVTLTIANAGVTPNFWNVNANGNWTTGTNWTLNSAPNGAGAVANFGGGGATITAPRTVTLNANQTVGSIGFNSAQSYTISGANTLTLNNDTDPVAQITNSQGSHTIGVALNAVSPTTQFTVLAASDALTVSGQLSGTTNVIKNGDGTLNLTAANSYVGNTTLASGTFALSGAGTLGNTANALNVSGGTLNLGGTSQTTGAVTISGGTISNGTITPASFTSTGTGASTISANITGATGVTQDGTGTLTLTGNNTYTGDTAVNAGVLAISSLNSLGSATNSLVFNGGAFQVNGTAVTNFGTRTLVGFPSAINLTDGGNTFTVSEVTYFGPFAKQGPGKLVMNGTTTLDSSTSPSVQGGTLEITGSFTGGDSGAGIEIAPATGSSATLSVVPGATVNTSRVIIGGNTANTSGGSGTLIQTGGTINAGQWFTVGSGSGNVNTGASGVFTMTGGTLNASTTGTQNMEVANFTGTTGTVTISGDAAINIYNNAALAMGANNNAGSGTFNQNGGTVTFYSDSGITPGGTGGLRLGNAGTLPASSTYTYNLNGGTLATPSISRNTGGANVSGRVLNFNGGTLKATAANATFIVNTITTNVKAGGAKIDTNGFDVTIPAVLAHDTELGAAVDGGLIKDGAGTLTLSGANSFTGNIAVNAGALVASTGIVGNPVTSALGNNTIAGRTVNVGSGAALRLETNDVFGNQTAVPGNLPALIINGGTLSTTRYNQIGALTLNGARLTTSNTTDQGNYQNFQFLGDVTVGGTAPSSISTSSAANFDGNHLAAATRFTVADVTGDSSADLIVSAPLRNQSGNYGNAAGGLVKAGAGTMFLTGANTYAGTTAVDAGTLITTPAQTGATTVNVADGATFGVKLATAQTTFNVGTLTTGTTTGATLLLDTDVLGNPAAPVITAATFNPVAPTLLNVTGSALTLGTNIPLLDYTGSIGGVGFGGLSLALPARVVGSLVNNTADTRVDLNITQFEQIKWKGNVNGTWDADTDGTGSSGTQNWVTTVIGTPVKYLQGTGGTDTVNFDDSATGTTNINIATAVSPIGTTFNNSTLNYTISSTGGFGIGGTGTLTKSGTGNLTLNTANTYSGGTTINGGTLTANSASALGTGAVTINGGTLNVNNASALGIGTLTVNGGTLNNTSGSAVSLAANNVQNWNGDFAFTGTNDLDMGTSAVTVGGTGTDRTVTIGGGTLTVGELRSATQGLAKEGAGTLVLTSTGTSGATDGSRVAGVLNVAAGTLQFNRTGTTAANSGDLTTAGVIGSGTIVNGGDAERWLVSNTAGTPNFAGTLANGGTGALGFQKLGAGTQTLSGENSYTGATTVDAGTLVISGANSGLGTNATVNAGNLVIANGNALGGSSLVRLAGNNTSTLSYATDGEESIYSVTMGTGTVTTIVSDRATPGEGINHTLTTQSSANGLGGGTINFTSGTNVTSGTGRITFNQFGLGSGFADAVTVLNPTTANVILESVIKSNNATAQTLELGGTSLENEITGSILDGSATVSLTKSGTSKWTLSGSNSYTGATTVNGGTLLVQGSISGSSAVNVYSGTLGGTGSVEGTLTIGDGTGTKDAILAPGVGIGTLSNTAGVNFLRDAVFALEINSSTLTTDLLTSIAAISLGLDVATLNVADLGNATVNTGQTFTFLSGEGGITGQFAGLPDGAVFGVGSNFFEINYTPTSVELIAVPEPASATLLLAGGALLGVRRVRRRGH